MGQSNYNMKGIVIGVVLVVALPFILNRYIFISAKSKYKEKLWSEILNKSIPSSCLSDPACIVQKKKEYDICFERTYKVNKSGPPEFPFEDFQACIASMIEKSNGEN